jgi:hypothetical protein
VISLGIQFSHKEQVMKKILLIASLVVTASVSSSVWADTSTTMNDPAVNSPAATSPAMNGAPASPTSPNSQMMTGPGPAMMGGGQGEYHPCKHIAEACKAAGFTRGGAPGKDMMDCIKPLMHGQLVPGVSGISSQDLAACKAKHDERKMHGGNMGGGMQPQNQSMQPAMQSMPNTAN